MQLPNGYPFLGAVSLLEPDAGGNGGLHCIFLPFQSHCRAIGAQICGHVFYARLAPTLHNSDKGENSGYPFAINAWATVYHCV